MQNDDIEEASGIYTHRGNEDTSTLFLARPCDPSDHNATADEEDASSSSSSSDVYTTTTSDDGPRTMVTSTTKSATDDVQDNASLISGVYTTTTRLDNGQRLDASPWDNGQRLDASPWDNVPALATNKDDEEEEEEESTLVSGVYTLATARRDENKPSIPPPQPSASLNCEPNDHEENDNMSFPIFEDSSHASDGRGLYITNNDEDHGSLVSSLADELTLMTWITNKSPFDSTSPFSARLPAQRPKDPAQAVTDTQGATTNDDQASIAETSIFGGTFASISQRLAVRNAPIQSYKPSYSKTKIACTTTTLDLPTRTYPSISSNANTPNGLEKHHDDDDASIKKPTDTCTGEKDEQHHDSGTTFSMDHSQEMGLGETITTEENNCDGANAVVQVIHDLETGTDNPAPCYRSTMSMQILGVDTKADKDNLDETDVLPPESIMASETFRCMVCNLACLLVCCIFLVILGVLLVERETWSSEDQDRQTYSSVGHD